MNNESVASEPELTYVDLKRQVRATKALVVDFIEKNDPPYTTYKLHRYLGVSD